MIVKVLLLLGLAVLSIALSAVEAAFYLVRRRRLSHLGVPNERVQLVNRYLDDPPMLLMPAHMGTYTAHVGMTVCLTAMMIDSLKHWSLVVTFAAMVGYLLAFRLTLPYALVRRHPERSLLLLLPLFDVYARMLGGVVWMLRRRADPEIVNPSDADDETAAAPEVPPAPVHDEDEDRLLQSVTRFASIHVSDVMTPRPDVVGISASGTVADLRRLMRETKYSRIPVYGENVDDILGAVTTRDLLAYDGHGSDPLRPLVRPVLLVPDSKKAADLLRELQSGRTTFAVVIDEYGGTAGVVSVEDIVEEIVGEIEDEYDVDVAPLTVEPDGGVVVSGRVSLNRLERALDTRLTDGEDVDTVGGLVSTAFGRIPEPGETIDWKGFTVEVLDAEHKRVNRARFRRKPVEAA